MRVGAAVRCARVFNSRGQSRAGPRQVALRPASHSSASRISLGSAAGGWPDRYRTENTGNRVVD
jgi:hypothetical protein